MPKFGLKAKYRPYQCTVCGHGQEIQTNHTDQGFALCSGCSWKCYGFAPDKSMDFGGQAYRLFKYTEDYQ